MEALTKVGAIQGYVKETGGDFGKTREALRGVWGQIQAAAQAHVGKKGTFVKTFEWEERFASFVQNYFERHYDLKVATETTGKACEVTFEWDAENKQVSVDPTIPVLNMKDYLNPATRDQFVADLKEACQTVGFFALTHPGIDVDLLDRTYAEIAKFYGQSDEEKMSCCRKETGGQRGYWPGEGAAKGGDQKDVKEMYQVGREVSEEKAKELGGFVNVWGSEVNLKEPLLGVMDALDRCIGPLQEALALAIGMKEDFLSEMTGEGEVLLRALFYPANPPEGTVWAAEHTDIDLFTIIPRTTTRGLQVKSPEGEWVDVIVPDDAFIVNVGDKLQNLTNGLFHSGLHRVIDPGLGKERYSMPYFIHPRMGDDMTPLKECIEMTGGKPLYPKATSAQLLFERLADMGIASEWMLKELAESGLIEQTIEMHKANPDARKPSVDAMKELKKKGFASEAVLEALEKME